MMDSKYNTYLVLIGSDGVDKVLIVQSPDMSNRDCLERAAGAVDDPNGEFYIIQKFAIPTCFADECDYARPYVG